MSAIIRRPVQAAVRSLPNKTRFPLSSAWMGSLGSFNPMSTLSAEPLAEQAWAKRFADPLSIFPEAQAPISKSGIAHSEVKNPEAAALLTEDFKGFLRPLMGEFAPRYRAVLQQREDWFKGVQDGSIPLERREDKAWIREDKTWRAAPLAETHKDRRVELTGPISSASMLINMLNAGAPQIMPDCEDSQAAGWEQMVQGHLNIKEAVNGTLSAEKRDADGKVIKTYEMNAETSNINLRLRNMHMVESHVIDESGRPCPAGLFDLATHLFNNAKTLIDQGKTVCLYVPKMESYEEACLVHDMIKRIEEQLDLPKGHIRVTALIESASGCLQAEEILYGLGEYGTALNVARWDQIASVIKHTAHDPDAVLPDRHLLNMKLSFLENYMRDIVRICHSRGASAMGGMAAQIPDKDPKKTALIMEKVIADKLHEVATGCDGVWVAHPGMVELVLKAVSEQMGAGVTNQHDSPLNLDFVCDGAEFFKAPSDLQKPEYFTEEGLRGNIEVAIQYMAAWMKGVGAVAINGLMEDVATAEISRRQLQTWLQHGVEMTFADGSVRRLDAETFQAIFAEVVAQLMKKNQVPYATDRIEDAASALNTLVTDRSTDMDFITHHTLGPLNATVKKPKPLNFTTFQAWQPNPALLERLRGGMPEFTLGSASLATTRGAAFNNFMRTLRKDGLVAHGSFLGTPYPHSARYVIEGAQPADTLAGGKTPIGAAWPYVGGWEINARGLGSGEGPRPDTLWVTPRDQGDSAGVANKHLAVAQRLVEVAIDDLPEEQREAARKAAIDFMRQPMLADLEQGWSDVKKIFHSVLHAMLNGINIMHIEDQGPKKRCGHLGGKELAGLHDYLLILRSANLAAQCFEGVNRDGSKQNINFVARTDALSAVRIEYSKALEDPDHPDFEFIQKNEGDEFVFDPTDSRYVMLKKGINHETGREWGLEHAARRTAEAVKAGLASHVWMETPKADIAQAKEFLELVNEHLAPFGVRARELYNHSPSFVWDDTFYEKSVELAWNLTTYVIKELVPEMAAGKSEEWAMKQVKNYLWEHGDSVQGDQNISDGLARQIVRNGFDASEGEKKWADNVSMTIHMLRDGDTLQHHRLIKELKRILGLGYRPVHHITNILVSHRVEQFRQQLSDSGAEVHLCTLPLYAADAHTASKLAHDVSREGIYGFVRGQRAARKYDKRVTPMSAIDHQSSSGIPLEVIVTGDDEILAHSTEADDKKVAAKLASAFFDGSESDDDVVLDKALEPAK